MRTLCAFTLLFCCTFLYGQERFSEIDGQKFRIKTMGSEGPVVVFENGMSDSLERWGHIPDTVAKFARVFLYDRADIGKSDPSRQERTLPNTVDELRNILQQEGIEPPYIFVGHSLGGLIGRYFAGTYPDEITGLILLDPSPESFWWKMSKRELKQYIKGGNEWYQTRFESRYRKEWYQFIPNLEYMRDLTLPSELPVVLISASAWNWFEEHKNILSGLTNTTHVELEGQHHIHLDHPETTIGYIRKMILGEAESGREKNFPHSPAR